jgi:hypothetical protein
MLVSSDEVSRSVCLECIERFSKVEEFVGLFFHFGWNGFILDEILSEYEEIGGDVPPTVFSLVELVRSCELNFRSSEGANHLKIIIIHPWRHMKKRSLFPVSVYGLAFWKNY